MPTPLDAFLIAADKALKTLSGTAHARRPMPNAPDAHARAPLTEAERRLSGALMRVNHVGEVCAQALYDAQALGSGSPELKDKLKQAAREETDHLAWTANRLEALGSHQSVLNPLWYGGAFAIGLIAGRAGDAWSLGFVAETERQVEQHLARHLQRLPEADAASRAVVMQMKIDEAAHADMAVAEGARPLPPPVRWLMRASAMVMTATAHRI